MDTETGVSMDDQTEVPQCETTTADGKIRCELDAGHEGFHDPEREFCGERDEDGAGCLNQDGHDGPHRTRGHMWGRVDLPTPWPCELPDGHDGDHRDQGHHYPAGEEVSWPPREWKTPTWATVTDLVAQVAGLTSTVRTLTEQTRILRQRLDAQEQRIHGLGRRAGEPEKDREELMGHAGPDASPAALRQHISEQASLTRRHVSVVLGTHLTRIEELLRERDIVPEDPAQEEPGETAGSPCTATAQSPTGLVSCTLGEGHTGSHMNALAVWSDAPPVPPGGVYEVY